MGKVQFALTSGDRLFRQQLSLDISERMDVSCSAILHTKGVIIKDGGQNRLNSIQFYGVDIFFDEFSPTSSNYKNLALDEIAVNSYIASKMNLAVGDEVLLRFEKLDGMPKDSPLSDDSEITVAERFKIKFIADDEKFGRFGLKSEQIAPYNVFLSIGKLASLMSVENSANMLLVNPKTKSMIGLNELNSNLKSIWNMEDSGIKLYEFKNVHGIELRSDRVFLDKVIIDASINTGINYSEILTYFVNQIDIGNNSTPYSFVTAASPELLDFTIGRNDILINQWAAKDLNANVGSKLSLKYFTIGKKGNLSIDSSNFVVSKIVSMDGIYNDKNLLPDYPGLVESESCMDWHPGIPIDFKKIRKKDEIYWEKHKGTPKAFISLDKAKEIWKNRFGNLTAIRFFSDDKNRIEKLLTDNINPSDWNIQFLDVRKAGLEASNKSVDFGGLFIGLSFFVIISALLLTSMMFYFNLESRNQEIGLFIGVGFEKKIIKNVIFAESGILILTGGLLGCVTGIFYNHIILVALSTIWSDVIGTSALEINVKPLTVIIGFLIITILNFLVIWLNVRKSLSQTAHSLQRGITQIDPINNSKKTLYLWISIISFFAVITLLIIVDPLKGSEVFGLYFTIGFLLLLSGITLSSYVIGKFIRPKINSRITIFDLAIREITRKRSRSILLITLLASSLFIVFTVGINKKNVNENTLNNKSGTGGFTLFGETSIPFYKDLNSSEFRKKNDIDEYSIENLRFIQMKVKSGEDASCLNLNRVKTPQVIGINSNEFIKREAFTFSSLSPYVDSNNPWSVLDKQISHNVIPGIADASVIQWQLGKSIGDSLKYMDDSGNEFFIVLVAGLENSIFQGNILISESNFLKRFNSINGYNLFISELSNVDLIKVMKQINYAMQDYGLNLSTSLERLSQFNMVENTYLSIFLILGSFGILIGSLGIGIVVFRNISEQKKEFALFQAVGINKGKIISFINLSYLLILIVGIFIGIIAAIIASLPSLMSANSEIPYTLTSVIIISILLSGGSSIYFTSNQSLKGNITQLLRNE